MNNQIEIYQGNDGQTQLKVKFEQETVWLNQKNKAELFGKDVRTINEHIKAIYKSHEVEKDSIVRDFRAVQKEG